MEEELVRKRGAQEAHWITTVQQKESEFRVDRSVGVTRAGAVEPSQSFTTEGLEPTMVRPGRVTRFFMAVVAFAERLNLKYSKVGNLSSR